jgi:hypothetical protein
MRQAQGIQRLCNAHRAPNRAAESIERRKHDRFHYVDAIKPLRHPYYQPILQALTRPALNLPSGLCGIRRKLAKHTDTPFAPTRNRLFDFASGGARTHNLRLRRPTLYPIELRTPIAGMVSLLTRYVKQREEQSGRTAGGYTRTRFLRAIDTIHLLNRSLWY